MANPFLRGWGFADQMQNTANQRNLGMLSGAINFQNAQQQQAIRDQALQQDKAFREGIGALGPNPDLAQAAFLAAQHGKPEITAQLFNAVEARKLREAMATQSQTAAQEAIRIREQERRQSREDADARARQSREELMRIAASLRQPPNAPAPHIVQTANGPMMVQPGTNQLVPLVGPGGAPVKPPSGRAGPMSATAQKELIETEEQLQGSQAALSLFQQAKSINDKAMGFTGAGALANAATILPESIRPSTVEATLNLDNMLQSSALPQLKAIFGGMPTEGERKILLDVQGSSSKPPAVRREIFDRAEKAIEARMKFASEKAKRLREGTYFTGEGLLSLDAGTPPGAAPSPAAPNIDALLDKYK